MSDFDSLAKDYDTDRRIKRAIFFSDELRLHITEGHNKAALEYGCGTGLVGFNLIPDFQLIIFVDSSAQMIKQVNQKLLSLGNTSSFAICRDFVADIPKDLKVDYIFTSLVLHHIEDTKTILLRFYNILSDKGHLLIIDKNGINMGDGILRPSTLDPDEYDGFDQSAMADLAREIGFVTVETKSLNYDSTDGKGFFILDAIK